MSTPLIHCPVKGCGYWVADGGYTVKALGQLKSHVAKAHSELPMGDRRMTGGIVDEMVSRALLVAGASA